MQTPDKLIRKVKSRI